MVNYYKVPVLKQSWPYRAEHSFIPAIAGCFLLCASVLPWLKEPSGATYCAWQLPLYSGWLDSIGMVNYGVLCLVCAIYAFLVAWAIWRPFRGYKYFARRSTLACCLCIVPLLLFLYQYLFIDVSAISLLARHKAQVLLVQQHFGYQATTQLLPLDPLMLHTSTFVGRSQLLLDQISFRPFFLCVCILLVLGGRLLTIFVRSVTVPRAYNPLLPIVCVCVLVVLLLRAPGGMICEYAAKQALSAGSYSLALNLLGTAHFLTPDLEQTAYYHRERGQAQYFLAPDRPTADSQVYLAAAYREQKDYLDAYQALLVAWRAYPTASWVIDEMDITLESMTEAVRPLRGDVPLKRTANDDNALPWLQVLTKVDPSNIYGFYFAGRIQYDLHNYNACIADMVMVIHLSSGIAIHSSAYTYIALSEAGLDNYAESRLLLFKAIELDPDYHNTTAREELSGLH